MRPVRFLAVVAAVSALPLAACTTETQRCSNGTCDIDLSGPGAKTAIGGDGGSTLELVRASGTTADVKLDGKSGTLSVGQPIRLTNGTLELVKVEGKDDVQIRSARTEGVGGTGGDAATPTT